MDADRAAGEFAPPKSNVEPQTRKRSESAISSGDQRGTSPDSSDYTKRQRTEIAHTAHTAAVTEAPLPYDEEPPLPDEAPPQDDGWEPMWDHHAQAYYFFNRITQVSQWENPRVPEASMNNSYGSYHRSANNVAPGTAAPGTASGLTAAVQSSPPKLCAGGYNPAIHGNYDPNADYAIEARKQEEEEEAAATSAAALAAGLPHPAQDYGATGQFNRFTGRFQADTINPENHNDEAKSRRQMNAFFDVDAAANSHDGRSLKAERRNKTLTKKELKAYKDKRRDRKEEKRRAWLRD